MATWTQWQNVRQFNCFLSRPQSLILFLRRQYAEDKVSNYFFFSSLMWLRKCQVVQSIWTNSAIMRYIPFRILLGMDPHARLSLCLLIFFTQISQFLVLLLHKLITCSPCPTSIIFLTFPRRESKDRTKQKREKDSINTWTMERTKDAPHGFENACYCKTL